MKSLYFEELENNLGIKFFNHNLLAQALVHKSYLNEHQDFYLGHNERLEFLGDAVLELVVSEYLFENYPEQSEGVLTAWRAALVNSDSLFQVASDLKLEKFILLSKGEIKSTGKAKERILANTVEAIIGAIYLDQGIEIAKKFIKDKILIKLNKIIKNKRYIDSKSFFQEKSQNIYGITPTYEVLAEWGPDHDKTFRVGVFLDKELVAEGEGKSKRAAQEAAAKKAIKLKGWETPL